MRFSKEYFASFGISGVTNDVVDVEGFTEDVFERIGSDVFGDKEWHVRNALDGANHAFAKGDLHKIFEEGFKHLFEALDVMACDGELGSTDAVQNDAASLCLVIKHDGDSFVVD